jgi:hypothetical protein
VSTGVIPPKSAISFLISSFSTLGYARGGEKQRRISKFDGSHAHDTAIFGIISTFWFSKNMFVPAVGEQNQERKVLVG